MCEETGFLGEVTRQVHQSDPSQRGGTIDKLH